MQRKNLFQSYKILKLYRNYMFYWLTLYQQLKNKFNYIENGRIKYERFAVQNKKKTYIKS